MALRATTVFGFRVSNLGGFVGLLIGGWIRGYDVR